jgi:hypothetical protein
VFLVEHPTLDPRSIHLHQIMGYTWSNKFTYIWYFSKNCETCDMSIFICNLYTTFDKFYIFQTIICNWHKAVRKFSELR